MKYCFIDTETSGTDPDENALLQIAGWIAIDGKIVERFDIKAQPFETDVLDSEALKINGITEEMIRSYPDPKRSYRTFIHILGKYCDRFDKTDKLQFVAYNGDFDADFIRSWFNKNGDQYFGSWFWWPVLDVAKIAAIRLMDRRHLIENFRLGTVAKYIGIDVDESRTHDAMYDIELTMKVFKACLAQPALTAKAEA